MKEIKSFFRVFGLILFVLFLSPISVHAEEMSDTFKQILNDDGKLVVTDTSHNTDMPIFLWDYLRKYGTNEYYFDVSSFDKETSNACVNLNQEGPFEQHCVEVVFEEKFSDEFSKALTDGKILVPNSTERAGVEDVSLVVYNFSDEKYSFNIDAQYDTDKMEYVQLINDDLTEVTVVMRENDTRYEERHIVEIDFLEEPTEEFIEYVGEDMTLEFNSVVPSSEEEFYTLFDVLFFKEDVDAYYTYVNDDFSSCDLKVNGETHSVDVIYNYDKEVSKKLKSLIDKLPEDLSEFKVKDMEVVNYWFYNFDNDDINSLPGFSGELKSYMNNYNVDLKVNTHAGNDSPFVTGRLGMAALFHNGIAYYSSPSLGAVAEHVLYVPDNTGDKREQLITAVQKRINEYLGSETIAKVTYAGKAIDVWVEVGYELTRDMWEEGDPNMSIEEWKMGFMPAYEDFGSEVAEIDGIKENDDTFYLTFKIDGKEKKYPFFIKKDSSKMIVPTYKTADTVTNITVSSDNTDIPLDTAITAEQLTEGKEYERIIKILDVEDNLTYDIKLYSNSLGENITKLEDGTFEVKIPLSKELKNKSLVAYYVDEKGNIEPFDVDFDDNKEYAIFKTSHFSIYTLAEGKNVSDDDLDVKPDEKPEVDQESKPEEKPEVLPPKTGDNIVIYFVMGIISLLGFALTFVYYKKLRTN